MPRRRTTYPETDQAQRIGDWAKLLRRANEDIYYQWQLAQNLQKLTLETLAHDERVALKEIRQTPTGVIILVQHKLNHPALATNLVRSIGKVENWIAAHPAPFLAKLYRASGKDLELGRPGKIIDWSAGRL